MTQVWMDDAKFGDTEYSWGELDVVLNEGCRWMGWSREIEVGMASMELNRELQAKARRNQARARPAFLWVQASPAA